MSSQKAIDSFVAADFNFVMKGKQVLSISDPWQIISYTVVVPWVAPSIVTRGGVHGG